VGLVLLDRDMDLDDALNKVALPNLKGSHSEAYHSYVYNQLLTPNRGLRANKEAYRNAVSGTLDHIRIEATTTGSRDLFLEQVIDGANRSDDQLIAQIFAADANYGNHLSYTLFPEISDEHNSSSFMSSLMNPLGLTTANQPTLVPGFNTPVPTAEFR